MCTGIKIKAEDGAVIIARTCEFGVPLDMKCTGVPAGAKFVCTAPEGNTGKTYTAKYSSVGINSRGMRQLFAGVNEKGLVFEAFNHSNFAVLQKATPDEYDKCMGNIELNTYILATCANVDEAIAALKDVKCIYMPLPEFKGNGFELHYRLADPSGRVYSVEYLKDGLRIEENPLGVYANSPDFQWMLTNLTNYLNLSANAWPDVQLEDLTLKPSSLGSGMAGLPGDFTSPSRFVRATAFQETHAPSPTADDAVRDAFHLLNLFDIPKGASMQSGYSDITQYTQVIDMTNRRYFFRTRENSAIRQVNLDDFVSANHSDFVEFDRVGETSFQDITATAKAPA
ncbi:MAG: linear amide C-N hydrolase [Myxococcales bacterium]|nr:linear amide C-N hydrolase [Myxococcales bacterium]